MKFKIRKPMNAGNFIGLGIGICAILIIIGLFKLTWSFWAGLYSSI